MSYMIEHAIDGGTYALAYYLEGFGLLPVVGTAGKLDGRRLPESFPKSPYWPTCTRAERDQFVRERFPHTWDYEQEQAAASLDSASL